MMYTHNFVACIKVNGRILRENKERVRIPFGSEYSVLVKNLNSVRAHFKLSIDGKNTSDISDGKIIIGPNQEVEIERYITGGNYNQGNKFKFIERTAAVEQHRGIGAEDGLVRVEFWKEQVDTYQPYIPYCPDPRRRRRTDPWFPDRRNPFSPMWKSSGILRSSGITGQSITSNSLFSPTSVTQTSGSLMSETQCFNSANFSPGEVGVTAPGSISNQQFVSGEYFPTESTSHVIVLHLLGEIHGKAIKVATTVNTKVKCVSCGKVNKTNSKFCSSCGTGLELIY